MNLWMVLVSGLLLAGSVRAQDEPASYGFFGPTCSEPSFSFLGLPRIGSSFSLRVTGGSTTPHGAIARTNVVVLTGFSNTRYGTLALPLSVGPLLGPIIWSGFLLTSIEHHQFVESGPYPGPTVSIPFPIPNDPSLVGCHFYQQLLTSQNYRGANSHISLFRLSPCAGHGVVGY